MCFSQDSRWLAADTGTHIGVWDLSNPDRSRPPRILPSDGLNVFRLEISREGRWVFTSRSDATAQLWDLWRKDVEPINVPTSGVQGSAISPDGRWLAMCKRGPTMQFFDLHAPDPTSTRRLFYFPNDTLWNLAISGDSKWLMTASGEGTVRRIFLDTDEALEYAKHMTRRQLRPDERSWYGVDN
jgi:WD40 repeat protein